MEFKIVASNNTEEQDISSFAIQGYEDLSINLVHEGKKLSEVWKYYGLLYNGNTLVNPHRYYCSLCFKELLENINNGYKANFSTVHNVSISTATGNLKMHLLKSHNVRTFPDSEKDKYDLTFAIKPETKRIRSNVEDALLHTSNIDSEINHVMVNNTLEIGLTEICCTEDNPSIISSYYRTKSCLKHRIQSSDCVTLLSEIWFNPTICCYYLKIHISLIDTGWEVHNYFLCYRPLSALSSDCIQFNYESVLKEFSIKNKSPGPVHLVCTRLFPLMPLISDQEICCVFLTHQLIAKYGLYSSNLFSNLLDRCLNILSSLNLMGFSCLEENLKEGLTFEFLTDLADVFFIVRLDKSNPLLSFEVCNTPSLSSASTTHNHIMRIAVILYILKFFDKYTDSIVRSLHLIGQSQYVLDESEVNIVKNSIHFINNLEEFPDIFRDCNNTLIVVPILKNKIREFCEPYHKDEEVVKQIKSSILSHLNEYYQMTTLVKMACILDPSVRDILDKDDTSKILISKLRSFVNDENFDDRHSTPLRITTTSEVIKPFSAQQNECVSTSKKLKLLRCLKPHYPAPSYEDSYVKEVKQYLQHVPTIEESESPLLFWKNHAHLYPNLAVLARQYLGVPSYSMSPDTFLSINSLRTESELQNLNLLKLNAVNFIRINSHILN